METKKIEIEWQGNPAIVEIKRLTYKERLDLRRKSRVITNVGGRQQIEIDDNRYAVESWKLSIVSAPFELKDEAIMGMDGALAMKIEEEIEEFNRLSPEKK